MGIAIPYRSTNATSKTTRSATQPIVRNGQKELPLTDAGGDDWSLAIIILRQLPFAVRELLRTTTAILTPDFIVELNSVNPAKGLEA
jgi:hypothetical protein